MINLKAFAPKDPVVQDEVCALDMVDAILELDAVLAETDDIFRSVSTVEDIKSAITGREIDAALLAYAGESIGLIAPAFTEGDSEAAVQQMEEGLKDFGASVMKLIRKIMEAIKNFFKKLLPFISGTGEKIDILTTKLAKADKVEWKKDEGSVVIYNKISDVLTSVETVVAILENVLDVIAGGSLKSPDDFSQWKTMVDIAKGEGAYDIEKNKADVGKEEKPKSEVSASDYLATRDWKNVDSLNKKLSKLVPKIEKFVKKKVDKLEYDKEQFADISPAEAIQALAKYSRTFVGLIAAYLNDTLKGLKQIKAVKSESK